MNEFILSSLTTFSLFTRKKVVLTRETTSLSSLGKPGCRPEQQPCPRGPTHHLWRRLLPHCVRRRKQ